MIQGFHATFPRRSALYVPGSNARAVAKAKILPADVIIFDLEDSVAPEMKIEARETLSQAIRAGGVTGIEFAVRVNGLETPWGKDDLAFSVSSGAIAVLVPKVDSARDVHAYNDQLSSLSSNLQLWTMIETARSIGALTEIARTAENTALRAFVMGINDLAKETRAKLSSDRSAFLSYMSLAVAAARSYSLQIFDGVHNEIDDLVSLQMTCEQGRDLGFDGRTLVHPSHLEICNRVYGPSAQEITWAESVVQAFAQPENAGKGVLRLNGQMVELLHRDEALRVLSIDDGIRSLTPTRS